MREIKQNVVGDLANYLLKTKIKSDAVPITIANLPNSAPKFATEKYITTPDCINDNNTGWGPAGENFATDGRLIHFTKKALLQGPYNLPP